MLWKWDCDFLRVSLRVDWWHSIPLACLKVVSRDMSNMSRTFCRNLPPKNASGWVDSRRGFHPSPRFPTTIDIKPPSCFTKDFYRFLCYTTRLRSTILFEGLWRLGLRVALARPSVVRVDWETIKTARATQLFFRNPARFTDQIHSNIISNNT